MPFYLTTVTALNSPFVAEYRNPIEWQTTGGAPVLLLAAQPPGASSASVFSISSAGVVATDKSFTAGKLIAASAAAISACLHSDGSTTPYYFVGFGATGDAEYRNLAGTWAAMAGTPKQCDGFFSENGNLWGVVNGYQMRKWPAGTNPVSGTAGAAVDVGNSAWTITGFGLLARSYIVVVKPDGIYVYDIDTNRFENIYPTLGYNLHADTGKGTFTWGADCYVPLGWGGMVRVTPNLDVIPCSPIPPEARPDGTTPGSGPVRALAGDASHLWAATVPFQQQINGGVNLYVQSTNDEAAFTNRTAVATDDDRATTWTAANGTYDIYVGATVRFGGFWLDIVTGATGTQSTVLEYYNGSAWTSVSFVDNTGRLGRPGAVVPAARIPTDWAQNAVNSVTRYWLRWRQTSGTVGGATIGEVRLIPDPVPLSGTRVTQTGRDDAGMMTHILRGYPNPDGTFFWEDVAVYDGDCSLGMIFTRMKATGASRVLLAVGPLNFVYWQLGPRASPDQQRYANCVNGFGSRIKTAYDDRIADTKRAPGMRKGIEYIDIFSVDFSRGDDLVQAWVSFDGATPVPYGSTQVVQDGRARLRVDRAHAAHGFQYSVHATIEDVTRGEKVPKITRIVAGVYPMPLTPEAR